MSVSTLRFDLGITAVSSIKHGGELEGTTTQLRREHICTPDGSRIEIPIISGNALRAALRRTAEQLLRDVLSYDGKLPYAAAIALLGGGRLTKAAGEPLSGQRLLELRTLNPLVSIFGASTAGTCIQGCLAVGKVIPHLQETAHLIDVDPAAPAAFDATQNETYTRVAASDDPQLTTMTHGGDATTVQPAVFEYETFPAGQKFASWLQLAHASDLEVAFLRDVLATYAADATLGGRTAIGHGRITVDMTETLQRGSPEPTDWRRFLAERRDDAIAALEELR